MFSRFFGCYEKKLMSKNEQLLARKFSGHGHHAESKPGEFLPPPVSRVHKWIGEGMGAIMWLWVFYRLKKDGLAGIGLKKPFNDDDLRHYDEYVASHDH